jgi:hypothetical protein
LAFGQKVQVPVAVEVDEATPLPEREVLVVVRAPRKLGPLPRAYVLEEHQFVRALLNEEIHVSIVIDVHELGARDVEATQKRWIVKGPALVPNLERIDRADETRRGLARRARSPRGG